MGTSCTAPSSEDSSDSFLTGIPGGNRLIKTWGDLDDPTRLDPEVPDVDAWGVHRERRERGADLAPMIGAVVQRLREPNPDRGVPLVPVVLVDLVHHRVRVEVLRQQLRPENAVVLHRDPKRGQI